MVYVAGAERLTKASKDGCGSGEGQRLPSRSQLARTALASSDPPPPAPVEKKVNFGRVPQIIPNRGPPLHEPIELQTLGPGPSTSIMATPKGPVKIHKQFKPPPLPSTGPGAVSSSSLPDKDLVPISYTIFCQSSGAGEEGRQAAAGVQPGPDTAAYSGPDAGFSYDRTTDV